MHHLSSHHQDPPLEGPIIKLGNGMVKTWEKRWMCVAEDSLCYYKLDKQQSGPDKSQFRGRIKFSDILEVKLENDGHAHYPYSSLSSSTSNVLSSSNQNFRNSVDLSQSTSSLSSELGTTDKRASMNLSMLNESGGHSIKSAISSATTTTTLVSLNSNLSSSFSTTHFTSNPSVKPIHAIKEYGFSIKIPDRVYQFKTLTETDLHYWIQGIKNIQVELALHQSELRENQRASKRLTLDDNSFIRSELFYLQKDCQRLRKDLQEMKENVKHDLEEFQNLGIEKLAEELLKYNNRILLQVRRSTSGLNSTNSSNNLKIISPILGSNNNSAAEKAKTKCGQVLWHPDDSTSTCSNCKIVFNVFRRRHHCRNCGRIFCSKCTKKSCSVNGYLGKVRVCEDCFNEIQLEFTKITSTPYSLSTLN